MSHLGVAGVFLLTLVACGVGGDGPRSGDAGPQRFDATELAEQYSVVFETTAGDFTIDVTRSWSPNGADRFRELVDSEFYDGCRFFRVVPDFMVQFGINGTPATHAMWKDDSILDDAVVESNLRAYVSFAQTAQPNSRTTQLFINYGDNSFLDSMRFSPFGVVRSGGMEAVDGINSEYGETPDQEQIVNQGTAYLDANFPNLDYIVSARR